MLSGTVALSYPKQGALLQVFTQAGHRGGQDRAGAAPAFLLAARDARSYHVAPKQMNRTLAMLALCAGLAGAADHEPSTVRVLGQRVNLRARADLNAEVVGQVTEGDSLQVKSVQGDWVEVRPPDTVDLWVNKDLVNGNRVTVNQANVRAGPGINYTVVGRLARDEVVAAKGSFGEWLRIAPFPSASLWVSRDLLEIPAGDGGPAAPPAATNVVPAAAAAPPPDLPPDLPPVRTDRAPPADLKLIPFEGQGRIVEHEGQLKTSGFLLGAPGSFRLVHQVGRSLETVVYLRGNREQLRGLLDQRLRVTGPEYWVERMREPVLVVEKIQLVEGPLTP